MKVLRVHVPSTGGLSLFVAERRIDRLRGLAGLAGLPAGTGLLIPSCRSVHTAGMRFAIDVLFATLDGGALAVHDRRAAVGPLRVVRASAEARSQRGLAVVEVPSVLLGSPGAP